MVGGSVISWMVCVCVCVCVYPALLNTRLSEAAAHLRQPDVDP